MVHQLSEQFIHAGRKVVLQLKIWEDLVEEIKTDAIISRVSADFTGIGDFCSWKQFFYSIRYVSDLVIIIVAANVYGLVIDLLLWRIHKSDEGSRNIAAMYQG